MQLKQKCDSCAYILIKSSHSDLPKLFATELLLFTVNMIDFVALIKGIIAVLTAYIDTYLIQA